MDINEINLGSSDNKKDDDINILDSMSDEYTPIHQKDKLLKFLLYTAKVEIKSNSLIKMIYQASLYESGIWLVGLFIFLANPYQLYYIWCLVLHLPRSYLGFLLLKYMPKAYEIIEKISTTNPNFEEDQIIPIIQAQIRESFIVRWTDNKLKFLFYLIATLACTTIDLVMLVVMIVIFGNDKYVLLEICLLFVTLALVGNIIIY